MTANYVRINSYLNPAAFIGGPLHGQSAAYTSGPIHEHVQQLGVGLIHPSGVKVHKHDPTEYRARTTHFYYRMDTGHYRHGSLSEQSAKGLLE